MTTGRAVAMEGVALDVTERHRLAECLLETQAVAHLGSWEWNVASNRITCSDELYRLFGLAPGEFAATYEAHLERVHPEDRPLAQATVARTVETHQPFAADYRIVRPDGQIPGSEATAASPKATPARCGWWARART